MKNTDIPEDLSDIASSPVKETEPIPDDLSHLPHRVVEEPAAVEAKEDDIASRRKKVSLLGLLFLLSLLTLVVLILFKEIHEFLAGAFMTHLAYGWACVFFAGLLVFLLSIFVIRDIGRYLRLRSLRELRQRLADVKANPRDSRLNSLARDEIRRFLRYIERVSGGEARSNIVAVRERMSLADDALEWENDIQDLLLPAMDKRAERIIEEEAINVAIGTAVSPWSFVDAIITMWRNIRLIRRIAEVYKVRAGACGTLFLVRRCLISAALAAGAQELSGAAASVLGSFLRALSSLGQGIINGVLTIRVGLAAQKECRPLAMPSEQVQATWKMLLPSVKQAWKRFRKATNGKEVDEIDTQEKAESDSPVPESGDGKV